MKIYKAVHVHKIQEIITNDHTREALAVGILKTFVETAKMPWVRALSATGTILIIVVLVDRFGRMR